MVSSLTTRNLGRYQHASYQSIDHFQ